MSEEVAYLIGLRVSPETEVADWYTVWYDDDSGEARVAMSDGRVQWFCEEEHARRVAHDFVPPAYAVDIDVAAVCDLATVFFASEGNEPGDEMIVLDSLNLLDDMLRSVGCIEDLPNRRTLDLFCSHLTMGDSIPLAAEKAGGNRLIIDTVYAAVGRLFAWSTFNC